MRKSIVDYCIMSVTLPRLLLFPLGALLLAFPLWPVILHTLLAQSLRFSFRTWRLFTYGFVPTLQAMSFSIGFLFCLSMAGGHVIECNPPSPSIRGTVVMSIAKLKIQIALALPLPCCLPLTSVSFLAGIFHIFDHAFNIPDCVLSVFGHVSGSRRRTRNSFQLLQIRLDCCRGTTPSVSTSDMGCPSAWMGRYLPH